jgi:membrane protein
LSDKPAKKEPPTEARKAWRSLLRDARRFFETELWDRDLATLPRMRQLFFALCRVGVIVVRGFLGDNCGLQASALTYITLMSLVPMLALMFSFSKGVGLQNRLIESIGMERHEVARVVDGEPVQEAKFEIPTPPEGEDQKEGDATSFNLNSLPKPAQRVVVLVFSYVENTRFGKLGLVSLAFLFWAVIKSVSKVEHTFNHIWGVTKARPFLRKLCDYFFVLALIPIAFLVATSATAMLSSPAITGRLQEWVGPLYVLYKHLIRLSGLVLVGLSFSFLYLFMPNTKVKVFPALVAGFVTAVLWYFTQYLYLHMQIGLTKFNAIYGTFAALPFFLAWLYANWTLILFGAEISFALQHHETFVLEGSAPNAPEAARVALGMVCVHEACKAFYAGTGPWSATEYSRAHTVPARLILEVCGVLADKGILVSVADRDGQFLPGRDIAQLTPGDVEEAFRGHREQPTRNVTRLLPDSLSPAFVGGYETFADGLRHSSFRQLAAAAGSVTPSDTEDDA